MAKKFVICDNKLIIGDVDMHYELVRNENRDKIIGGGWWHFDRDNSIMYFYSKSVDFGQVTKEQFDNANKQLSVRRVKRLVFSTCEKLGEILIK